MRRDIPSSPAAATAPRIPGFVNKRNDETEESLIHMKLEFYEDRREKLVRSIQIERQRIAHEEESGLWQSPDDYAEMEINSAVEGKSMRSGKKRGGAFSSIES